MPLFSADADEGTAPAGLQRRTARLPRPSRPIALALCNLGSGSGGNCTVLRVPGDASGQGNAQTAADDVAGAVLIDAGFGPRTVLRRLAQAPYQRHRLTLDHIHAICLTHLDRDHFRPSWINWLINHRIRLVLHRWHLPDLDPIPGAARLHEAGLVGTFHDQPLKLTPTLTLHGFRCQHDRQGTIAYRFEANGASLGYATDLGHVPTQLVEHFQGVDALAIESNYDHHMTIHSPRPAFVNRRNLSDSGHLSNDQAFEAVQRINDGAPGPNPRHILLLHRSSQCNHPMKVRRTFERDPRLASRITLTDQRRRTRWLRLTATRAALRHQLPLTYTPQSPRMAT